MKTAEGVNGIRLKNKSKVLRNRVYIIISIVAILMGITSFGYVNAATLSKPVEQLGMSDKMGGLIAAAIAISAPSIGAGVAIYGATSAGAAAIAERPAVATWILIFAGLGEGIAIYGLVVAIMILGKL